VWAAILIAGAVLLLPAAPAAAQSQPAAPWDGQNPFVCQLQNVGTGDASDAPDQAADPFCIEFDKTQQNVTDFGLVDFFSKEPDRVGVAATKCFYFQSDHWTGSIQQGQQPELWHWDGHYFFDKAKGIGGVFVTNFRIGGQPTDYRPYAPPDFQPYMTDAGGGGVITTLESGPDPSCVARTDTPQERAQIYRADFNAANGCAPPGGELEGRRIGWARLGKSRRKVTRRFGPPDHRRRGVARYCLEGSAEMRLHYGEPDGAASAATAPKTIDAALSTSLGHRFHGVGRGTRLSTARHRLEIEQVFRFGGTRIFEGPRGDGRRIFFGVRRRKVRWVAMSDRLLGASATKRFLRNANRAR
jgi:hypothetical protein